MNSTTRRAFLVSITAALPLAGLAAWLRARFAPESAGGIGRIPDSWKTQPASAPWTPDEPFPYLEYFEPYPPGQPLFEKDLMEPSFLHPNGNWVVLPEASGGFEVWDWRQGVPVQSLGGVHPSDHLAYPCGENDRIPGCFTVDGNTWIHGRAWHGGDDGHALMGTGMDGSGTWDYSMTECVQIDPRRSVVHVVGQMWGTDGSEGGFGVSEIDATSGEIKPVADLPPPFHPRGIIPEPGISPNGRWLLAWHPAHPKAPGSNWGWWAVWSVADGRCRAFEASRYFQRPVFSRDGATAYITEKAWNWSGQETRSEVVSSIWSVEGIGPSILKVDQGQTELVRKGEGVVEVHSTRDSKLIRRLVAFPPNSSLIAFGPRPELLLAAPPSGQPWLWNRKAPLRKSPAAIQDEPLMRPGYSAFDYGSVRSLAWSVDGIQIAVGVDAGAIGVFDAATCRIPDGTKGDETSLGKPLRVLTGLNEAVRGLVFTPEGLTALGQNGTLAIWGGGSETPRRSWKVHTSRSNSLQASSDGRVLATGSLDGVALWSGEGKLLRRLGSSHSGASCVHFDPSSQWLAATYLDGWLAVFDVRSGRVVWETQAHSDVAAAVAFHPSGAWLVSLGWDAQMRKWDAKKGSANGNFSAPEASGCLAFSRDGKWLAIGGSHPEVRDESLARVEVGLNFLWNAECT